MKKSNIKALHVWFSTVTSKPEFVNVFNWPKQY